MPPGTGTRPTSDRAREALFSTLESLVTAWAGRRVLDLYAGSGAVGLEALSRGAAHALLVEADARAARTISDNVGSPRPARRRGARTAGSSGSVADGLPGPAYDVVFADPPYDLADAALAAVLADLRPALADGAVVAVERATRGGQLGLAGRLRGPALPALRRGHALVRSRHSGPTGPGPRQTWCRGEPSVTERRCVCPGSFDPVTNGHLDIIERASRLYDEVDRRGARQPAKTGLFEVEERIEMLRRSPPGSATCGSTPSRACSSTTAGSTTSRSW